MGFDLKNIVTDTTSFGDERENQQKTPLLQREIRVWGKSFSNSKKEDFYTELSVLLKAGVTLKKALTLIEEGQKKASQKKLFRALEESLLAGNSFSEAIQQRKEFTQYEYYSLKIGEESGTLETITRELGLFFAKKNEQRRTLVNALTYPVIILVTAVLVVIFMLRLVVPMFQDIFKQNNVELPWITRCIVALSNAIKVYGGWMVLVVIGIVLVGKLWFQKEHFKKRIDYGLLHIPYLGNFLKAVYLAQFTRAISLLTASKVPVLHSIELAGKMIDFYPLRDALHSVKHSMLQGESLSNSLSYTPFFSHKMIAMIKVAEETNQTEFIFERLHQHYSTEVQQKSKLLSTLLEPVIILGIGICVGVILVAMYLPMFKLGNVLG